MAAPFIVTKSSLGWDNWYFVVSRKRRPSGKRGKPIFVIDRLGRTVHVDLGARSFRFRLPKWA
ncbi:hypothetical protein AB6806_23825 [Bosea sp. RCC_152_1]|uniref:hypothetical protein n=1 Tax=Bosea sp. RCC_152_1 TaxID=3239228 RepID=UPI0035254F15